VEEAIVAGLEELTSCFLEGRGQTMSREISGKSVSEPKFETDTL